LSKPPLPEVLPLSKLLDELPLSQLLWLLLRLS
jgi:hypothetical protein